MKSLPPRLRLLLILPAVAALVCGVLSGLARLGMPMPMTITPLIGVHGVLMIGGFFGTLVALERAVAIGLLWPYLAPLLSGMAALAIIIGAPITLAQALFCLAAFAMSLACVCVWHRQPAAHHALLTIAALLWLAGNLAWVIAGSVSAAVPLWSAFFLLTIAAERLELSRLMPTPLVARVVFAIIVLVLLAGALGASAFEAGLQLFAVSLFALSMWLLRFDIARYTIKAKGLTRYMAVCLLTGYVWLAIAAAFGMAGAFQTGAMLRDAALHALLLGFVLSMVFGHAPIILPAVTTMQFHWHRGFYFPLLLLHLSLAVRVMAGITEWFALRQYAAIANAVALLLFMLMAVTGLRNRRQKPPTNAPSDVATHARFPPHPQRQSL